MKRCQKCDASKPPDEFSEDNPELCLRCFTHPKESTARAQMAGRSDDQIASDQERLLPDGQKVCSRCKLRKRIAEFCHARTNDNGLENRCRLCASEKDKRKNDQRRARTDAEIKEYQLQKYGSDNSQKICSICEEIKDLSQYHRHRSNKDGLCSGCKPCQLKEIKECSEYRLKLKSGCACLRCGWEGSPYSFEFAHRDRKTKLRKRDGRPRDVANITILEHLKHEVTLCDIICTNCHAHETWLEGKSTATTSGFDTKHRERNKRLEFINAEKRRIGECHECKLKVPDDRCHIFDFDHQPQFKKTMAVSAMARSAKHDFADLTAEMAKCLLSCKRCHRVKTVDRATSKRRAELASKTKANPPTTVKLQAKTPMCLQSSSRIVVPTNPSLTKDTHFTDLLAKLEALTPAKKRKLPSPKIDPTDRPLKINR